MSLPSDQQNAFDSLLASLQADLLAWEQAPTVPEDFDPARPWVLTPGGGLTIRKEGEGYVPAFLEPGNLASLAVAEWAAPRLLLQLGRPWTILPVRALRDVRVAELTGAIEHLKGCAPPEPAPSNIVAFED